MLLKSVLPVMSVYPLKSVVSLTSVDHLAAVASLAIFVPAGSVFLGREVNLRKKTKTVRFSPLLQPVAELPTNQRLEGYIVTGIQAFIVLKWNVILTERQGLWFLSPLFRSVCISRSRLLSILGGRYESPHFSTVFYCANVIHLQCLSMLTPKLILNSKESLNVIYTLFPYRP